MSDSSLRSSSKTRRLFSFVKWGLFALTLYFVGRYGVQQFQQVDWATIPFSPGWLLLAGVVYFLGWVPAAIVWWHLLAMTGQHVRLLPAIRAHFCGHLGKYVPGKALSLVIRAALLKPYGVSIPIAGLLATVETLLTMATGLLLVVVFLPVLLGAGQHDGLLELFPLLEKFIAAGTGTQIVFSLAVVLCAGLLAPAFTQLLNLLIVRFSKRRRSRSVDAAVDVRSEAPSETTALKLKSSTILMSGLGLAVGWIVNGLSLGCILAALEVPIQSIWTAPLLWTATVAGATSLGFFVLFAPGGLGVREAIVVALLQLSPAIEPPTAVLAALLLRIVSFSSELVFSAILYWLPLTPPDGTHQPAS